MDLFAQAVQEDLPVVRLRRVHFNALLHECHKRLHAHSQAVSAELQRQRRGGRAADPRSNATAATEQAGAQSSLQAAASAAARPWNAVAELVRKFVEEESAPEQEADLSAAMNEISASICSTHLTRTAGKDGAPPLVDDPRFPGRPVSCGVLCFDEVQMMDIADATIVAGVLDRLFDAGWVLVATCNRTPKEFAQSTMHKEHPQARFAQRIAEQCDAVHLRTPGTDSESPRDYRRTLTAAKDPAFLSPLDSSTAAALEGRFESALAGAEARTTVAHTGPNRSLNLIGSKERGVARTSFAALCDTPLGAIDYISLAQQFHTIFVTDVPQLSLRSRDQARRFITLVDQLYNHRTQLVASAAVPLTNLFEGAAGGEVLAELEAQRLEGLEFEGEAGKAEELNPIGVTANSLADEAADVLSLTGRVGADSRKRLAQDSLFTGEDETFAFRRAISRLTEMQSEEYLGRSGAKRMDMGM